MAESSLPAPSSAGLSPGRLVAGGRFADVAAARTRAVGIVGAGVAGLALAAALRRRGIGHRVYEQAPAFGEVGAGIQLAPNATRLLDRLGLGPALAAVAVRPAAIEMRAWDSGEVLGRTELGESCVAQYGAPYLTMHRADLHRVLAALVDPRSIVLGARIDKIAEDADGVGLAYADGRQDRVAVLVGADGVRSAVRAGLHPDQPRYSGHTIYRGLVPADAAPWLAEAPRVVLWLGPGKHAVAYPVSGGRQISFGATFPTPTHDGGESWSAPADPAAVLAAYEGWHPDLRDLLAQADRVSRWALHDRDPIPTWSTARITLAGDAAHPMLPFVAQGANQAIEDAFTLARQLAHVRVSTALARYEHARKTRTERVQSISRGNATALHDGSRPDPEQQRAQQQWLYGFDAEEG
ncbi:FAD-dependent monooxygenase [Hamadaea sp. NPDC051192]|uniref:FAD-dependent monooxygenase n=1 Tax=Hamadaea sp. NPDC051192 TaxID=3154940 RepID=UPI003443BFD9